MENDRDVCVNPPPWVLVQFKGNFGFERQAGALKDDFWGEFVSHNLQYN